MRKVVVLLIGFLFFSGIAAAAWAEQPWVGEVRTGKAGVSPETICKKIEQVMRTEKPSREASVAAAKDLLAVFGLTARARDQAQSCYFEPDRPLHLRDNGRVMEAIIKILDRAQSKPEDIGTTPAALRQLLLKEFKAEIAELRKMLKEGRGGESDIYGGILGIAEVAARDWNFTPQELGLTNKEVTMLRR